MDAGQQLLNQSLQLVTRLESLQQSVSRCCFYISEVDQQQSIMVLKSIWLRQVLLILAILERRLS